MGFPSVHFFTCNYMNQKWTVKALIMVAMLYSFQCKKIISAHFYFPNAGAFTNFIPKGGLCLY